MKLSIVLLFFLSILTVSLFAQTSEQRNDLIKLLSGESLTGRITSETESQIKFINKDEHLSETIKMHDIASITYGDGRFRIVNESKVARDTAAVNTATDSVTLANANTIAVLPFLWDAKGARGNEDLRRNVQKEFYEQLSTDAKPFNLQSPSLTNQRLKQLGYTLDSLKNPDARRLCKILNVGYLVFGNVRIFRDTLTAHSDTSAKVLTAMKELNTKVLATEHTRGDIFKGDTTSLTSENFSVSILLTVSDGNGNTIYTRNHNSYWVGPEAVRATVDFLVRKSPFYNKQQQSNK